MLKYLALMLSSGLRLNEDWYQIIIVAFVRSHYVQMCSEPYPHLLPHLLRLRSCMFSIFLVSAYGVQCYF